MGTARSVSCGLAARPDGIGEVDGIPPGLFCVSRKDGSFPHEAFSTKDPIPQNQDSKATGATVMGVVMKLSSPWKLAEMAFCTCVLGLYREALRKLTYRQSSTWKAYLISRRVVIITTPVAHAFQSCFLFAFDKHSLVI